MEGVNRAASYHSTVNTVEQFRPQAFRHSEGFTESPRGLQRVEAIQDGYLSRVLGISGKHLDGPTNPPCRDIADKGVVSA